MSQILFIHPDLEFTSRIREEAGNQALTTPSMLQALQWISNPEIPISGIYLNPNVPQYSALHFLEITLLSRPATPVFLIDSENEIDSRSNHDFLTNSNIKGVFKGRESFREFLAPLGLEFNPDGPESLPPRKSLKSSHEGYIAIPLQDFEGLRFFPYDVFVENEERKLRFLGARNGKIDTEYLSMLQSRNPWLFVSEASILEIRESIRKTQNNYTENEQFPAAWKTAEVLFNAKNLLREFQKGSASDGFVEHAHLLLNDLFGLVSSLNTATKLAKMIQMAKECDRTLHCTTLAIMMAKVMRIEHGSIVEILGLASFLQDISLFQTPYGDLSDAEREKLAPEAKAYFDQHPILSADLLSKNTTLPEVILQVVRQHHERRDRSGYPNRVGGMQLHPMSEVLSIINAYLDAGDSFSDRSDEICSHYSEKASHALFNLLNLLDTP
ncbi:MAG: hypothetical protein KGP28_05150 [Bdellovibrionales bacterium]|nr:hypothetical protein [Bdellovibrionales bacterium]